MTGFPDQSSLPVSEVSGDPIRGGSIGLNRILGMLVEGSNTDSKPRFHAVMISAFTVLRNVWNPKAQMDMGDLEEGFVRDINLFLDYFDAYLGNVMGRSAPGSHVPVIVYFPNYQRLPKEIVRERTGQRAELFEWWGKFFDHHAKDHGQVKRLENCRCLWIRVGDVQYPHVDLLMKFREITSHKDSLYTSGDPIALMSHIMLDWHLAGRLRGVRLLESHTGTIRKPGEFAARLDKSGLIPFLPCTHFILGDSDLIKPEIPPKIKREILEQAEKERWITRGEDDLKGRLSKITGIAPTQFRKYYLG